MWWTIFSSIGNFFKLRWRGVLIIVLGVLILLGIWHYKSTIEDKIKAIMEYKQVTQTLQEQKKAFQELKEEQQRVQKLEEKYEQKLDNIEEYMRGLKYNVKKIEENNSEVRDWGNNTVPNIIPDSLRGERFQNNYKNRNGTNSTSQKMDGTNQTSKTNG